MTESNVNIPLLRKAVEWAEAEAAKPPELCEWEQGFFALPAESEHEARLAKAASCGTCYCIAGFVAAQQGYDVEAINATAAKVAADALGITANWLANEHLFNPDNTIEDVRRIAESLAGERL